MQKFRYKYFLFACIATIYLLFNSNLFAAGLYHSHIASPGSLGTAGVANVTNNWGTDSAWTNPAGMTGLKKDQVMVGMQVIAPNMKFDSSIAEAGGNDGGNAGVTALVPGVYAVKTLSDSFRLGFSVAVPLGGGVDYRDNFVGRYQAIKAELAGAFISPSFAYKVNDKLSVGAGVSMIYTLLDQDIAVNQPGALPDGKVEFDELDDWSYQGFLGLTFQLTDKAMFGGVYRTQANVDLDGDIKFRNIQLPIINQITSNLDKVKIDFDLPQLINVGLKYDATDDLKFFMSLGWEDWSTFSKNRLNIAGGAAATTQSLDRNFKDTYHIGVGLAYDFGETQRIAAGVLYDSSPVDDKDRTADMPFDEQFQFSMGWGSRGQGRWGYSLAASYLYLGDGKIDQTAQGVRFKGEFDTNYAVAIGGMIRYSF